MNISYKTDISKMFLYKHEFKWYNDSKERLFDKGNRKIRQIKSLGNSKLLLVSNGGALMTETVESREISVIAKLERIEIRL